MYSVQIYLKYLLPIHTFYNLYKIPKTCTSYKYNRKVTMIIMSRYSTKLILDFMMRTGIYGQDVFFFMAK